MDLNRKIQANDQGFFVVTFFNERDREKNLTETTLKYVFSKFGQVSDIKYTEYGRVFISYKEKEGAFKALEVMNMGTKYRVETDWQPVKKNETVQSTLFKQDMSFQNKKTNSNTKNQQIPTRSICRDFLKGDCRRGRLCRFRHLTPRQYEMEMANAYGDYDYGGYNSYE